MLNSKPKIPWWNPQIGKKEREFVLSAMDDNFINEGNLTVQFEREIARRVDAKYAVAVTSCTAGLFLALKAAGIGHGDEVIVPDITFIATANAVEMCGAKPVIVDVNQKTLTIDINQMATAITPKTKAVIPVHVSGRGCDMKRILEIAESKNIAVIEDAAEAFLSKHNQKYLGTLGMAGCFSFSPHKTITTGQGGAIVTNDDAVYRQLRELKDQGRFNRGTGGDDLHPTIGYNFKFTDLQAGVGLGQLTELDNRIAKIKRAHALYTKNLKNISGISFFPFTDEEVPQWVDISLSARDELDSYLAAQSIECRKYWHPIHTQKPYSSPDSFFPSSTTMSKRALWLPSAYTLTDEDIYTVCRHITEFIDGAGQK